MRAAREMGYSSQSRQAALPADHTRLSICRRMSDGNPSYVANLFTITHSIALVHTTPSFASRSVASFCFVLKAGPSDDSEARTLHITADGESYVACENPDILVA